jgi:phage protein D
LQVSLSETKILNPRIVQLLVQDLTLTANLTLQAKGYEVSTALGFLDKQILILGMENMALKQRLDSLSQKQFIKHCKFLL